MRFAVLPAASVTSVLLVDQFLKLTASLQQSLVLRPEIPANPGKAVPEPVRVHTGPRQRLLLDELREFPVHLKVRPQNSVHDSS